MPNMSFDKAQIASFDIDCQNAFTPLCPEELPVAGATEIVAELQKQALHAQYRIASKDSHCPDAIWVADDEHPVFSSMQGDNVDMRWPRHAEPGSKGFELIAGLPKVTEYDYFVWKGVEPDMHPYGSCYHDFAEKLSTGVIEFLHNNKVQLVLTGGLATDYCVKATVLQLCHAGFQVVVNLAAVRGIGEDTSLAAKIAMQEAGAILLESSQAIGEWLRS